MSKYKQYFEFDPMFLSLICNPEVNMTNLRQMWAKKNKCETDSAENKVLEFLQTVSEDKKDKKKPKKAGSATSSKINKSKESLNNRPSYLSLGSDSNLEQQTKKIVERRVKSKYVQNYRYREEVPSFEISPEDLFESINHVPQIEIL